MKFKEGNSVEVLRREDPCGSWFSGEIISADGDYCIVRFKLLTDHDGEPVVEKVPGEDVRPQPPHEKGKRWMVGDIAEVFDIHSWRVGKVAKVLKNNNFVIRLFGSLQVKEFHESNVRIRQIWLNNKWSIFGKVGRNKQIANNPTQNNLKYTLNLACGALQQGICEETCSREKDGLGHLKKNGHDHFKMVPPVRTVKRNHAYSSKDSNQCSVASCSFNEFADYPGQNSQKSLEKISDSSDAESIFPSLSGEKHLPPSPRDKLEVNIHKLELRAYKSTVQALYASGPLSWEQESLLTNLRLSLHISNEEHLLQLRHLLSTQVL